ncbi:MULTISPECIES: type II toxin-antitoxin system death-on-curing family toxin [unclassified Okeania]|uniref:type II toxin-antitoxin system death-on-curing family toxin n=1 Tax=unclassified Okeania TaxID=2634635 RepID=UPI0013BC02E9|nr:MULTISPECIES: type II toxin-antitoxin system death-on-curing family toxin [unclassified Okeania]NES78646.1 type II toxin-antitoxin system death-on-curing family toxin [Okeania sp. SIO1H4]NET15010.1 type II toxin-antitoxin system death-on-curing family toxin [Okeania sp. SIO1H6]NET22136.1 type II toxin-antitoxin system death-on-curing family toxin [Okeania sp. SIO1H5]NET95493.1 type II toxin-antitoxin system death-on-curing family toxin [Okeania sp. SIO1H2]
MKEPIWIDEIIAKAIHADQIIQHGGSPGIRDENLLSASLARPRHLFTYGQPNLFELAAAYGYSLEKNHPFIDGNKRTAFMVMYTFLGLNNYLLEVPESEVVKMMEQLASGEENQESLGKWLAANSIEI